MHPGHATCETLRGLLSLGAGLQVVAWPKTPHVVDWSVAHTTSPRRTDFVQELASKSAVALAATTHDMISATSVTSRHTLHACAHPSVCCTLYAASRPTLSRQHINPPFMCHQVVSQYTRTLMTHIFKARKVLHTSVFLVFCHVWSGHRCSSTSQPPPPPGEHQEQQGNT